MTRTVPPLRVWPGVLVVALQWAALLLGSLNPGTPIQFFSMIGAPTLGTLLLLLWWLLLSRARWSERGAGSAALVLGIVVAYLLAHKSMPMVMTVWALPLGGTAFVAAPALARGAAGRRGLPPVAAALAVLGVFLLLRSDGVRGGMRVELSPRFAKTAEDRLLEREAVPQATTRSSEASELPQRVAWPGFRGPGRDGVLRGVRIDEGWTTNAPEELWRRRLGPGWGSFAVWGNRLYTLEQRGEKELISCYDAASGEPLWFHEDEARFEEPLAGPGPRSTPAIHQGRLYAFGAEGLLNALDAVTGERLWSRDAAADTGAGTPDWGFAASPLVVDGLVVVYTGGPDGKGMVAYDVESGEPRWYAAVEGASYSSAHLAEISGVLQILILTGEAAAGIDPADGEVLWTHAWPMTGGGSRIVQPALTAEGDLLIGTGFGMGVRRIGIERDGDAWATRERWTSRGLKPYYNDLVVHRGHAYGFDGKIMSCIELESGERAWKGGRYGHGQLLLIADQDLLIVQAENGDMALVRARPDAFDEVARVPALEGKTWNHPVLVDDVLYLRNGEEMAAFRVAAVWDIANP